MYLTVRIKKNKCIVNEIVSCFEVLPERTYGDVTTPKSKVSGDLVEYGLFGSLYRHHRSRIRVSH
jgi:hypothetical protein